MKRILVPIALLLGGVCLLVMGFWQLHDVKRFEKTDAKIMEIFTRISDDPDETEETVANILYTVDGTEYREEFAALPSGAKEGDTFVIRYDPDNPRNIVPEKNTGLYVMLALGGVLILSSIGAGLKALRGGV